MNTLLIIIPVYNESENLPTLFSKLHQTHLETDIVIIDDGSSDSSSHIARQHATYTLRHEKNLGIAHSIHTGLLFANKKEYSHVIKMDADLQHNPQDIQTLLQKMIATKSDVVIGNRYSKNHPYAQPAVRGLAIRMIRILFMLFGYSSNDPTSGFWVMNKQVVSYLISKQQPLHESAMLCAILHHGFKVTEQTVKMLPRKFGDSKITFIKGISISIEIVRQLISLRFSSLF